MSKSEYANLRMILSPRSVAIIGASETPGKVGHVILQNYVDQGFEGRLYPVNITSTGKIMGIDSFKSVLEIKSEVDLAVIAVPAAVVPQVLEECGRAKVRGAVVVSGGFAEVGDVKLQDQLVKIAKKYSMPVIGPNCLGVMDPRSKSDTLFLPTFKIDRPRIGGVSFASQSGATGSSVLDMISSEGFGLARFISYGNAAVVDEVDILHYLMEDPDTKVIIFYIEGVKRGREFIEVAKKVTKIKPVIIIKGGITSAGAAAAHSHTAALAGSAAAYEAVFRQFGLVEATDLKELLEYAKMFDTQPLTHKNRVAIVTNGGGTGVLATDALYKNGLQLASLSKKSERSLKKALPPMVGIKLPLDLIGDADEKRFEAALDALEVDTGVDAIIVIALFQTPGADEKLARKLVEYSVERKKPMAVISMGGSYTMKQRKLMENGGLPVYDSPEAAARSIAALVAYSKYKDGIE